MPGLDGQLMTSHTQYIGWNFTCCLNLCDCCSDAGGVEPIWAFLLCLFPRFFLFGHFHTRVVPGTLFTRAVNAWKFQTFIWFGSLGWLKVLFGPTQDSCAYSLIKTVCHNFRYFKGFLFECLLWFLMLAQPQGHLSTLVLLLFALPMKLYPWSWRTSSELIPHSNLLPFQFQQWSLFYLFRVDVCETNYDTGLLSEAGTAFLAAMLSRLLHHMLLERYVRTRLSCLALFGFSPCLLLPHLFLEVHSASIWVNVM